MDLSSPQRPHSALIVAAACLLAGCAGGGASNGDPAGLYAGYSEGEAISSASFVLRSLLAEPTGPLFQKTLEVGEMEKGTMPDGTTRAWVAHLEDFDQNPSPWCLLVRTRFSSSTNKTVTYDLKRCNETVS